MLLHLPFPPPFPLRFLGPARSTLTIDVGSSGRPDVDTARPPGSPVDAAVTTTIVLPRRDARRARRKEIATRIALKD
jgi:hypothetical protein